MLGTDFAHAPEWHDVIYSGAGIERLAKWLREHRMDFVRMYHGTSVRNDVMGKGLLPTTTSRRNSYQSASGYVYLSIYPGMAYQFGRMASLNASDDVNGNRVSVYAVDLTVRRLSADLDQLANKRAGGLLVGNSLAESIVYGSGARVKGRIDPMTICRLGDYPVSGEPDFSYLKQSVDLDRNAGRSTAGLSM